ncbi:MAG: N-acetyltransferase family protein [Caldilineaceae bacterium SB0664_bin_27]|uniref:N-acetyltransferase family protein n=1 Tax=Caldilineaceae bacterium SB0664_bin_27 TaxID=2605260 RepID=A0A6B0YMB6_9CHLR|nr:N-acetyltransferase family protein [Caldilineaceae bacterium SB0664_bin_27]
MAPTVRLAGPQDAAGIRAIYAPIVRETPISFETLPPSEEEMSGRVAKTLARYPWLVCTARERVLGYAYAGEHSGRAAYQWSVNVSVYVHARCRRLGVGQALYDTLFAILRLQGFVRAFAGITLPNEASVGFHESFGFRAAGKFEQVGYKMGAWHDVGYWQLTIQPVEGTPAPPRPLPLLLNDGKLREVLSAGSNKVDCNIDEVVAAIDTDLLSQAD